MYAMAARKVLISVAFGFLVPSRVFFQKSFFDALHVISQQHSGTMT